MICPCCGKPKKPSNLDGLGTALKPAMELVAMARKPLSEPTVAANVLRWGTGAVNVDGCRILGEAVRKNTAGGLGFHGSGPIEAGTGTTTHDLGRWPANLVLSDEPEVIAAFPETGAASDHQRHNGEFKSHAKGRELPHVTAGLADLGGSAARYFYQAKADGDDRLGSKHPTVKPLDLMRWLVRLVTPPGGLVLDPFAGTGTTGEAAFREGMRAVLIEREAEYQADIRKRMALVMAGPDERKRAIIKAKPEAAFPADSLFAPLEAAE